MLLIFSTLLTVAGGEELALKVAFGAATSYVTQKGQTDESARSSSQTEKATQCEIRGKKELTISCTYSPTPPAPPESENGARIVLNRVEMSFELNHESHIVVQLEFTNEGKSAITPAPTVYLAIDDDQGRNVIRRPLPHVDFSKLQPGDRLTFSDRFLVGAFTGGHYTISLSIHDPEPSRTNTAAYNLLLSSDGVPDSKTGLNILAHFSVAPSIHSSHEK